MKTIMVNNNLNIVGDMRKESISELEEITPEIMQRKVFNSLRRNGWQELPWNRYVVLSFDIVSCRHLNPNLTPEQLEQLPPFALLFAIQIINTTKFQPIGKVFCERSVSPETIAMCIQSFIKDLIRCEYSVMVTVCKPMAFFRRVVESLIDVDPKKTEIEALVYRVGHLKIVHLYDPVTMLEHTFLLFLKYAVRFEENNIKYFATYDDCKTIMLVSTERDIIDDIFNHTSNIICAIRLFSLTCCGELQNCHSRDKLKDTGTIGFVMFFDTLFDSLHGELIDSPYKLNRNSVTRTSCHFRLWERLYNVLSTMYAKSTLEEKIINKSGKDHLKRSKFADDLECLEILNTISQSRLPINRKDSQIQLEKEIKKLKLEQEKREIESIGNSEIKFYDDDEPTGIVDKVSEPETDDFKDKYNSCLDIQSFNTVRLTPETQIKNSQDHAESVDSKIDIFGDYSKKLFLALQNSECSDIKKFNDCGNVTIGENDNKSFDIHISKDCLELIDHESVVTEYTSAEFVIQHFDTYMDYLEYFVEEMDMCKKTNHIKMILANDNIKEVEYMEVDNYIDDSEIIYDNETTVIDEAYEEDEKMEVTEYTDCANETLIADDFNKENAASIDPFSTDEQLKKSPFNIDIIRCIFDIFNYMSNCLNASTNYEETIADITKHLKQFNSFNVKLELYSDEIPIQTHAIYQYLIKLLTLLAINRATTAEQQDAYEKLAAIKHQLKQRLNNYKELQCRQETESVYSTPSFFNASINNKKETTDNGGQVHLNKIHEDMVKIYPEIQQLSKKHEGDATNKDESKSASENTFRPFIFDAWQISLRGMRKLFELLEKKRVKVLNMSSLNIDHIRQILNNVRCDHGTIVESNYHLKISFINKSIVGDVFETDGTIILR